MNPPPPSNNVGTERKLIESIPTSTMITSTLFEGEGGTYSLKFHLLWPGLCIAMRIRIKSIYENLISLKYKTSSM